jgi:hypothetical protein
VKNHKTLRKNVDVSHLDLRLDNDFLDMTPKPRIKSINLTSSMFKKIKQNFCAQGALSKKNG